MQMPSQTAKHMPIGCKKGVDTRKISVVNTDGGANNDEGGDGGVPTTLPLHT